VTLPASAINGANLGYTDSAAPYVISRFYRAQPLTGTNLFTGDHLVTTNGDVIIQPRNHASFVMNWNGLMIYSDPADSATFTGLAKADLILVTHSHSDHFSTSKIESLRGTNTTLIVSQDVYNQLTPAQKSAAWFMHYGDVTNLLGITVEAVHAYNSFHPLNFGNGYVLTIGGKRIYISGDTGNAPEIHQIKDIDVAFLCMNQPYTMTVSDATNAVTAILPKVVYPYHYRDQSGSMTSAATFKQRLSRDLGIEVRLRKWY
jgi:L-ascorbate metabolism protein UlaG (beta-lactamase superfamily)